MPLSKTIITFIFSICCILFLSCGKLYLKATGVKPFKPVVEQQLISYLSKQGIKQEHIYEVDSVRFNELLTKKKDDTLVYTKPNWWIQNHIQPIQTVCFDNATKKPLYAYFNCIAESKGLTQFTWNKFQELESFPPKEYTSYRWIDTLFTLDELTNTFVDFKGNSIVLNNNEKKYTVFIYYSLFVEKQANNLIRETLTHLNTFIPNDYNVYFINFDNALYQLSTN